MRICPDCQTEIADGKSFCPNCGKFLPLSAAEKPSATPEPAEKPVSVPGTLSLTLDFYTGIQYEITIHNGELKIYASDVGKTLTYKIKDNDPYDALLPYVSGTQEVNYITG